MKISVFCMDDELQSLGRCKLTTPNDNFLSLKKHAAKIRGVFDSYHLPFQVFREKSTSMGKISKRPASIAQDSTILLRLLN